MHNKFGPIALGHEVWIHDERLLHQWLKVLRFHAGDEVVLFNGDEERLYTIAQVERSDSVKLELVTELNLTVPSRKVYLLWAVLKNDKNDWILQKATELGIHKFVPIIAERSEKTVINIERAKKIIIEAAEQCGRSDVPDIREPIHLGEALEEYHDIPLYICEQHNGDVDWPIVPDRLGVLIGPEGGWTENEKALFDSQHRQYITLSDFTLRAETAAIVVVGKLLA